MPIPKNLLKKIKENRFTDKFLDLSEKEINDKEAIDLAIALKENSYIKIVNLAHNKIGDEGVRKLAKLELEELNLKSNNIGSFGCNYLSKSNIKFLNLTANSKIGSKGAKYFSNSPYIEKLSLSECEIGDIGSAEIFKNTKLKELNLSINNITKEGIKISDSSSLVKLNLSHNEITDEGVETIAKHRTLEDVDLSSNNIGDTGVKYFVKSGKIVSLDLTQNHITKSGFLELCKNTKIQQLKLYNNEISFDPEDSLDSLQEESSLTKLNLGYNKLNDECEKVLEKLVAIKTLEELDFVGNDFSDKGAKFLYQYKSDSLKKINLLNNFIQDEKLVKKGLNLK